MRFCPNCQSKYADDSLQFCLRCGTPLSFDTAERAARGLQKSNNTVIVIAILGVFALITIVVGGLGVIYFSRSDEKTTIAASNKEQLNSPNEDAQETRNSNAPSVERLNDNRAFGTSDNSKASNASSNVSKKNVMEQVVVSASSVRKPEKANFYFPNFAFDNNSATAWCEGANGAGAGEWLRFEFEREVTLKEIKIEPGYFKNPDVWAKNNRVARVNVEFSDGSSAREFELTDGQQTQTLKVGRVSTKSVRITILDFFAGTADSDDTLISEVSFVTE